MGRPLGLELQQEIRPAAPLTCRASMFPVRGELRLTYAIFESVSRGEG